MRFRRNDRRKFCPKFFQRFIFFFAFGRTLDLAYRDKNTFKLFDQSRQISVRTRDLVPQNLCARFIFDIDDPGDLKLPSGFDNIDTGTAVPAAAYEDEILSGSHYRGLPAPS